MTIEKIFFCLVVALCLLGTACDSTIDDFDVSENPLVGKIGGEEWAYKSANARSNFSTNDLSALLIAQNAQDPCTIRVSGEPNLTIRVPAARGSYNLPTINGEASVIFNTRNGTERFTAAGGFIQIVAISGRQAIGYLNAEFDDDNTVDGSFLLEICN